MKRYEFRPDLCDGESQRCYAEMKEDDYGDYVLFSDAQKLSAEVMRLMVLATKYSDERITAEFEVEALEKLVRRLRDSLFVGNDDEGYCCRSCAREWWSLKVVHHNKGCPVAEADAFLEAQEGKEKKT